eukprot:s33_g1.t1
MCPERCRKMSMRSHSRKPTNGPWLRAICATLDKCQEFMPGGRLMVQLLEQRCQATPGLSLGAMPTMLLAPPLPKERSWPSL